MSDEFFEKIDATLGKQKSKKANVDNLGDANRRFVISVIPRLAKIAEDYASKCDARGMVARVSQNERSITFSLKYKDGQERYVTGRCHSEMNDKLGFEEHFPDNDGKRYKSSPMAWYDESSWSDDRFKGVLEKTIEDFVIYAERFGGV